MLYPNAGKVAVVVVTSFKSNHHYNSKMQINYFKLKLI